MEGDGLVLSSYRANMRCIWAIRASSPDDVIVLTFDAFNTERCCDCVEVYDGTIATRGTLSV